MPLNNKKDNPESGSGPELAARLEDYNRAYRSGRPMISDTEYDRLVEELRRLDPKNPWLHRVEPEDFSGRYEIRHPQPMLSTEKAYTPAALARFLERVTKAAADAGRPEMRFRLTPKLDGLAARDDGTVFVTRGNGEVGYEISQAFAKGVVPIGGRGRGLGEIVILESYFAEHLAAHFEHPRNLVVGIVNSDTLNPEAEKALAAGAVHFVPYSELPAWEGRGQQLQEQLTELKERLIAGCDYPLDGFVVEVTDPELKKTLGHTDHHYRWQIALKERGETARTRVETITWQVGRTGVVTPVLEVEPVNISGATIRRVTAHNAGLVREKQLGPGARIEIIRSGEVIPKLEKVITPAPETVLPENCPRCGTGLEWSNDFLKCPNPDCPAQVEQRLLHWFKTLGTADWFGPKTIARLVEAGYDRLEKLYRLEISDFENLGFGPQQAKNLHEALQQSRRKPVEDWRFLAAFGIPSLGRGDSRRLLARIPLEKLVAGVDESEIAALDGFAELTAAAIARGIAEKREEIEKMLALGFNLVPTPLVEEQRGNGPAHPLSGKGIVFTGKMSRPREALEDEARARGARVQKTVSGKTDLLVCGEKVGARKIDKAEKLGIRLLREEEYLKLLAEADKAAG
jgi:DNA ligase (NAD+)